MFATDQNVEYGEAMNIFYNSESFEKFKTKKRHCIWRVQNMCMIFSRMNEKIF